MRRIVCDAQYATHTLSILHSALGYWALLHINRLDSSLVVGGYNGLFVDLDGWIVTSYGSSWCLTVQVYKYRFQGQIILFGQSQKQIHEKFH